MLMFQKFYLIKVSYVFLHGESDSVRSRSEGELTSEARCSMHLFTIELSAVDILATNSPIFAPNHSAHIGIMEVHVSAANVLLEIR